MIQMSIEYTSIFHFKVLQNLPKLEFWVWKQTIWQPCFTFEETRQQVCRYTWGPLLCLLVGLPDGIFSYQTPQLWYILEGRWNWKKLLTFITNWYVPILCGHLLYLMTTLVYIGMLWSFVIFSPFWYILSRTIWQPWSLCETKSFRCACSCTASWCSSNVRCGFFLKSCKLTEWTLSHEAAVNYV
jgi:hypothetical protein